MKLTEFKNDVEITLKNCNAVFEKRLIHGKALLYIIIPRFEKVSDLNIILSDSWELFVKKYTQREAFKMLSEGKVMGYLGSFYKFENDHLMRFYNDGSTDIVYNLEDLEDPSAMWTEYKEEN